MRIRAATTAGEWDQVFAFHKASLTASSLEVAVHEEAKKSEKEGEPTPPDAHLGFVSFDLQEVPKRLPPDRHSRRNVTPRRGKPRIVPRPAT